MSEMGINTMDYVRGVEQASGIYAQALHEYSIENTKLERENDRLKAENAKFRELVSLMDERDVLLPCMHGCNAKCRLYDSDVCKCIASLMRALGIEVE